MEFKELAKLYFDTYNEIVEQKRILEYVLKRKLTQLDNEEQTGLNNSLKKLTINDEIHVKESYISELENQLIEWKKDILDKFETSKTNLDTEIEVLVTNETYFSIWYDKNKEVKVRGPYSKL